MSFQSVRKMRAKMEGMRMRRGGRGGRLPLLAAEDFRRRLGADESENSSSETKAEGVRDSRGVE